MLNVPAFCDGCGAPSTLDHFLICMKGGLIVQWYNEIRNAIGYLAAIVWGQVRCEPIVSDSTIEPAGETLVADLSVRDVWLPQAEALFDVRVVDTDAQSYLSHTPKSVLLHAELKRSKNILLLVVHAGLTLHLCGFWWMVLQVVKHPPSLEDLQVALLLDGIEATVMLSHG